MTPMSRGNRVVLVTGASSGIGAATAALLTQRGFAVFGASRRRAGEPSAFRHLAMDVRDEAAVRRGIEEVLAETGRLDALVCCAGFGVFGSVEETSLERARAQFETNVFGTLNPIRAVLPHMRASRAGRIVVVGSLAGRAPIPFQAHYSATKAAVDALALALRNEVAPFGIGVSLVEPGDIRTAFNDSMDWGPRAESHYGERVGSCADVTRASLPKAPEPEIVARIIHRALTARRPRVRYTVGPDSLLVPLGRRLLPDAVSLALIRSHFKV
jgi:NAD(P)-dependent dehydrogenase (short-subunit alcohol dehydrogenase family)